MGFLKKFASNKLGVLTYKGTWDASANSPELSSGIGVSGNYYVVSVAGTTSIDGLSNWEVGDWIVYNSSEWQRLNTADNTVQNSEKGSPNGVATLDESGKIPSSQLPDFSAPVTSVNGMTGDVVIATGDAAIQDSITDGVTNIAPSQNAVYDALALKADDSVVVKQINGQLPTAGSVSLDTDNVAEGSTNLYFTSTRAKDATILDNVSGNQVDIAPSINSIKNYVDNSIAGIGFGKRYNYYTFAEQSSASTTYVSVTDLTSVSLPVGLYKFKFWGLMQSNSATNGVGVRINGTDAGISTCFAFWNISQASDGTNSTFSYDQTALTTNVVSQSVPAANTNLLVVGDGIFRVTSAGTMSIQIRSEGHDHTVKIMPDSVFSIDLIN